MDDYHLFLKCQRVKKEAAPMGSSFLKFCMELNYLIISLSTCF
ncbi:hypothetical protein A33Q_0775 [Indibacter alkaliphilus LW1]|uniref:Uncharacterized protein n=1 Tax=Indibacter alkaliphilus (strain CCUG 57479 / KCTC 22604 / LW1) TaxID=1189612 RepID=S2DJG0_INDAL|nr:hypothetical protein A33Q_0775 [Indibacter alkaliphilus LW1]